MKKTDIRIITFLAFLLIILGLFSIKEGLTQTPQELPKVLRIWTYGTGSTSYYNSMGMSQTIQKLSGMTVRVMPAGTDTARFAALKKGEGDMVLISDSSYWSASRGYLDYADPAWGPQKLRMVYGGQIFNMGVMTTADSGIKKMSDIRGKRFPYVPGNPAGNLFNQGYLAYGGLNWSDVKIVRFGSWDDAMRSVVRGQSDACGTTLTTAACIETAAGPKGIYLIPMPPDDKEAWARLQSVTPFARPNLNKRGGGVSPDHPHQGSGYHSPYASYDSLPEQIAYAFAKAAYNGYEEFKNRHVDLKEYGPESVSEDMITDYVLPMHPGCIKFLKEIGKWSGKMQQWQEERLLIEKELLKLWSEAPAAAAAKGIKVGDKEWPDFWQAFSREKIGKFKFRYAYL